MTVHVLCGVWQQSPQIPHQKYSNEASRAAPDSNKGDGDEAGQMLTRGSTRICQPSLNLGLGRRLLNTDFRGIPLKMRRIPHTRRPSR
jgi:hypothetical protein